MKFRLFLFFTLSMFVISFVSLQCCPICIGTILKDSPPFFSDEFYQTYKHTDLVVDLITTNTK